jgi:uncharacterized FAD-dependent dehydrogenase
MKAQNEIKLFESKKVRTSWNEDEEEWYFSIIDIIDTLTESSIPKRYWSDLKKKLLKEGSQLYEKIVQLKFEATDGKKYATDCLKTEEVFRLIQSIPSPKAEPFIPQNVENKEKIYIIGAGPAGYYAALRAIEAGLKPILFERGKEVRERRRDLAKINKEHIVNPESNYCFGEGGAGTYSDGKFI